MNALVVVAAVLLVLAFGASGSLALLYRARRMRLREQSFNLRTPRLAPMAGLLGGLAGAAIGGLAAYYLSLNKLVSPIEWIGRFSYALIIWAAGGHLLTLLYVALHVRREERSWEKEPEKGTLGESRMRQLSQLRQQHRHYIDLKSHDDLVIDELIGFLGNPLTNVRRDLSRIPLYGYLGTVCGILLMSEELSRIDEATETFKVLSSMAEGLVLAFKTTLVGLLAYLPLRKAADYLVQRVGNLEDLWTRLREEGRER